MAGLETPLQRLRYLGGSTKFLEPHVLEAHILEYFEEAASICSRISHSEIDRMVKGLSELDGKVYLIGLGGSLSNAVHMASDLRKLCRIDAEAFDNLSELTARANDEGLDTIFEDWVGRANPKDVLFILSVGGGTDTVSRSICNAITRAKYIGMKIYGITGPEGGDTFENGDMVIRVPVERKKHITPHTESFQAVIWHCLVSHPLLQKNRTKW